MNGFDFLDIINQLFLSSDASSRKNSVYVSKFVINVLSGVLILAGIIILEIELKLKYTPENFTLVIALLLSSHLLISFVLVFLLNRLFNIQYTQKNFILLMLSLVFFLTTLTFMINRNTGQAIFKIEKRNKDFIQHQALSI